MSGSVPVSFDRLSADCQPTTQNVVAGAPQGCRRLPVTAGGLDRATVHYPVSGCEIMPDREFAALEKTLTLNIAEAKRSASGGSADFSFGLTNRVSTSAKACLGPSHSVSYKAASSSGISSRLVDHPGCTREFTVQPGGVMSWAETLEVPRLSEGRVELEVSVQIVNPRRCGG